MPLHREIRIWPKISSKSNESNIILPVFVKKDYRHTTFVTGLLDELGWLPLFEYRKHSRLTVFYKAFNNLSAISLDHLSVSSWHTRAFNENKFIFASSYWCFQTFIFLRTITDWNSLPLAVRLLQSTSSVLPRGSAELGILLSLLIIMTLRR